MRRHERMNGPHDLGGAQGFGPVTPEPDEPWFHAEWERRVFALVLAMGATGAWNLDMSRHARERIPPADYLASSYYDIWRKGLERLLVEHGLATPEELAAGKSHGRPPHACRARRRPKGCRWALPKAGRPSARRRGPRCFKIADRVRAKLMNPSGHTRLPRYVRGRSGSIAAVHGVHVFPDSNAAGRGEDPQWLYSVSFAAADIWGNEARPATKSGSILGALS